MNLFLLRHGLAVEQTIPSFKHDSDRPLTAEGRKKLERLASLLTRLNISFDLILTSPYVRAAQTAALVAEALEIPKRLEISKNLAPGNTLKQLVEEINQRPRRANDVLLV